MNCMTHATIESGSEPEESRTRMPVKKSGLLENERRDAAKEMAPPAGAPTKKPGLY